MLSKGKPVTWEWSIILLRENGPALWSVTRRKSSEFGLGTAWSGMEYMPGSKLVPKECEKYPLWRSFRHWSRMNSACRSSEGGGRDSSCVTGRPSRMVSAQGQNPSRSPAQTELTKGRFGWFLRRASKISTLMGVWTWKRSGWSVMVLNAIGFDTSPGGGRGSGRAVSDHSAVVGESEDRSSHKLYLKYLGWSP